MASQLDALIYGASQAARVAWFAGHYVAGRRVLKPMPDAAGPLGPVPGRAELVRAMVELFSEDWRSIAAGVYAAPPSLPARPLRALSRSRAYFRDLPAVDRRRHGRIAQEPADDPRFAELPRYFRQNFHYQSGGYLSEDSAALYDLQVEVLFTGAADAMRRRALVPLARYLAGRNSRACSVLDVGCGTGRLLGEIRRNWPGLRLAGVDLSAPYVERARRRLGETSRLRLLTAPAEALPFADATQDVVLCTFLFHELPASVRRRAIAEMARVLRPGGRAIVLDSLQRGDRPGWDGLLDQFPHYFHEPYYAEYVGCDIGVLFAEHGMRPAGGALAYLAKLSVFDRP